MAKIKVQDLQPGMVIDWYGRSRRVQVVRQTLDQSQGGQHTLVDFHDSLFAACLSNSTEFTLIEQETAK